MKKLYEIKKRQEEIIEIRKKIIAKQTETIMDIVTFPKRLEEKLNHRLEEDDGTTES